MPVYQLIPEIPLFPPIEEAEDDGLLAVGGDLTKGAFAWCIPERNFPLV